MDSKRRGPERQDTPGPLGHSGQLMEGAYSILSQPAAFQECLNSGSNCAGLTVLLYWSPEEFELGDAERTIKLDLREIFDSGARRPVLVVLQGPSIGMSVEIKEERTVIGRGSGADIVLRDEVASRQHAEIVRLAADRGFAEYYLLDRGSTNGTFLNGAKIKSQQLLQDGDKIKIGVHLLKFAMLDEFEAEFQDRLHQMIQRDELTGLRSRRSLFADLDREILRQAAGVDPQPVSVLMMDLDNFKQVNDGKGHLVGSQVIREVGRIVGKIIGSRDRAARYGGEEYLGYLRDTPQVAFAIAENIRETVASQPFQASPTDPGRTMRVTISLGLASFPGDGDSALDLVQKADQALYRAKKMGRNRTCVYNPSLDVIEESDGIDPSAIMYGPAESQ